MRQESAETLALQALGWILGEEDLLATFLATTGASGDDLRSLATSPEFLGSVLEFLVAEDERVLAFAASAGIPPTLPMEARVTLAGDRLRHWT